MSEIFAISKAGFNVLTETAPNNFIFHSSYNTFKILHTEKKSINLSAGDNVVTFAHNAPSTPPLIEIFVQFPDGKVTPLSYQNIYSYGNAYLGTDSHSVNATIWDNTNIVLSVKAVGSPYTIVVVWFVYEPTLT